ncbi:hypothetical protein WJ11_07955 [Burkholderia cenocepacia]|nr:hypothetical protein WJ11_07955 [Burkholderia cenocepacia]
MTVDESNPLEELLDEWCDWQAGYAPSLGYGRVDPSCRGFSESERTLTADERRKETDRKVAKRRAGQVDVCIDALTWQERAAIHRHMKAKKVCGEEVWSNPRGLDLSDAHASYKATKEALYPRVKARGLLKGKYVRRIGQRLGTVQ